ncbi:MAG: SH3 domain-containing protein [Pseudomonadota bacterium]|uniref:SH3 domain-containing protein n=1 Tax=Sphingomonas sp. ERG5 TaxID=1381597 RepID=UPI00054BC793|nr:SH3 domain-containing protein [Sphingomonas sp. ERG5]
MRNSARIMLAMAAIGLTVSGLAPALAGLIQKKPPYFASISAGKARMRTGPARTYPASWLYQRADLPVKVIDVYERGAWLKIEDPSGTQGWMMGTLISEARTGLIMGTIAELRDSPRFGGKIMWRAAPGVVGRLSKCARGWCYFDVRGRGGYVEANQLWGVDPGESLN